jgi:hypothetical protein
MLSDSDYEKFKMGAAGITRGGHKARYFESVNYPGVGAIDIIIVIYPSNELFYYDVKEYHNLNGCYKSSDIESPNDIVSIEEPAFYSKITPMEIAKKGGEWLVALRSWMQWKLPGGDSVTWSDEQPRFHVSSMDLHRAAEKVAAAAINEYTEKYRIQLMHLHKTLEKVLKDMEETPSDKFPDGHWNVIAQIRLDMARIEETLGMTKSSKF